MLGNIQSNKAKKAVQLFDYIHSLDGEKLAKKIAQYEGELNRRTKVFIQINLGDEVQKSGILLSELKGFYDYCINDLNLNIIGLMCLPPINLDPNMSSAFYERAILLERLNEITLAENDYNHAEKLDLETK